VIVGLWIVLSALVVLLVDEWVDVFTGRHTLEHVREWRARRQAVDVQRPIKREWRRLQREERRTARKDTPA
jgi:hypothetical protein